MRTLRPLNLAAALLAAALSLLSLGSAQCQAIPPAISNLTANTSGNPIVVDLSASSFQVGQALVRDAAGAVVTGAIIWPLAPDGNTGQVRQFVGNYHGKPTSPLGQYEADIPVNEYDGSLLKAPYTIDVTVYSNNGAGPLVASTASLTVPAPASASSLKTTTLSVISTPGLIVTSGDTVLLSARLTAPGGVKLSGETLTVNVDGKAAGTVQTHDSGIGALTYTTTTAGPHVYAVIFAGDSKYGPSTSGQGTFAVNTKF